MQVNFEERFISMYGAVVQRTNNGQVKFWCPKCNKKSLSCNVITGQFKCWLGCGLQGHLDGYVSTKVGPSIDVKAQQKIINFIWKKAQLSKIHKTYLVNRGIWNPDRYGFKTVPFGLQSILEQNFTKTELQDSGILTCIDKDCKLDWSLRKPRLMIPYISDGQVLGLKMRANEVEFIDPSFKYMWPKGSPVKDLLWHPEKLGSDTIITEGEIAACVGCEYGITSCGISGMNFNVGSIKKFNSLCSKFEVKRKFIIIDTDFEMEDRVSNIRNALKMHYLIPNSCIAFLPHDGLVKSVDLDYYLNTYGVDILYEVLEDAWIQRTIYRQNWTEKLKEIQKRLKN